MASLVLLDVVFWATDTVMQVARHQAAPVAWYGLHVRHCILRSAPALSAAPVELMPCELGAAFLVTERQNALRTCWCKSEGALNGVMAVEK